MTSDSQPVRVCHVLVMPTGAVFEAVEGEALMAAAARVGIRWPNVCGGNAQCGVCHVELLKTGKPAELQSLREAEMLARTPAAVRNGGVLRLACQLPVTSDIVVFKLGVRAPPAKRSPD